MRTLAKDRIATPDSIHMGQQLFELCKHNTPDMALFNGLVDAGALLNEGDDSGNGLIWASLKGSIGIVRTLVELGVPLEEWDNAGCTALYWAAYGNKTDVLEYLISKGAKVDVSDSIGTTALICAAERGNTESVRILLAAGADMDYATMYGRTALDTARLHHKREIIDMLEEHASKTVAERERVSRMERTMQTGIPVGRNVEGLGQISANRRRKGMKP